MKGNTKLEKFGLENLMCNGLIEHTSGYRFKGQLNTMLFKECYYTLIQGITKFNYKLDSQSQTDYDWVEFEDFKMPFIEVESSNIVKEFNSFCANSFTLLEESNYSPMMIVIITSTTDDEFIIAQMNRHSFMDARSSEYIFNNLVAYYNASIQNDETAKTAIADVVASLGTVSADEAMKICYGSKVCNHENNINRLLSYKTIDEGNYGIPVAILDENIQQLKNRVRHPIAQAFKTEPIITACRKQDPRLSKNSIVTALIAKVFYTVNIEKRGCKQSHKISFKMVADILPPALRAELIGNYIAFVPFTVSGQKTVVEIAREIQDWLNEVRETKLDVSMYALTEEGVKQSLVGTADDPISFIITSWTNHVFTNTKDYLTGCTSIDHISGVNIQPINKMGGALMNRPVAVINFSPNLELYVSFFPSIDRNDDINVQLMNELQNLVTTGV